MKGLWINAHTFLRFQAATTSLTREIATRRGAIDYYALAGYLPNPDPVLKKQGKDLTVYRELLGDAHVGAAVLSRKAGVQALEWAIDRGRAPTRQAQIIERAFRNLDLRGILSEILNAPLYGYQPLEVLWERAGTMLLPRAVVGKPPEWFVFDEENALRLKTRQSPQGEALPERKFLLARHEATYQNPYGFPLLSRVFWPVMFKKGGLKFWVIFTEKYGMPWVVGKHPRGTPQAETDQLLTQLEAMVQDAVSVIPDDASVEIHEPAGKAASAEIYDRLLTACNAEVSKALLGQTLTTEVGEKGSFAAAQTHLQVRADVVEEDKRLVESVCNQLIAWIYDLNFPGGERPVFALYEADVLDRPQADRDEVLARVGVRFTKAYFQKTYGLEEEDFDLAPPPLSVGQAGAPPVFAESASSPYPDQQALDAAAEGLSPEELQGQMEGALKPVLDLLQEGESYDQVLERLVETYPDLDTRAIEQMLERAIFVSELWGRLQAQRTPRR